MGALLTKCLTWFHSDTDQQASTQKRRPAPTGGVSNKKMPKMSNVGLLVGSRQSSQRSSLTYLSTDNSPGSPRYKDVASVSSSQWGAGGTVPSSPASADCTKQEPTRTFWTKPCSPPSDGSSNPSTNAPTFMQAPAGYQQEMDDVRVYNESGGTLKRTLSFRPTAKNCDSASPRKTRSHRKN